MAKTKIALVALLAACGSISLVGCSSQNHSGNSESGDEARDFQEVGFALKTSAGEEVTSVDYKVTDSAGATVDQGTFQTPEASSSFKAQLVLRVASNYKIELSGAATVGSTTVPCLGSQTFNVVAGQTSAVNLALICQVTDATSKPVTGGAVVTATLQINHTPSGECGITRATVGPLTQLVGSNITLTSALVGTGAAGTWSATGLNGSFVNSTASSTTFRCLGVSAGSITLNVTGANGCTDAVSAAVSCVAAPTPAVCGNGLLEGTEVCDDGNTVDTDACKNDCSGTGIVTPPVVCGNGIVQGSEACDDGNSVDTDACKNDCSGPGTPPPVVCGNGLTQAGEQCDDNNTTSNDGCSATCQIERCGDGIKQTSEACDDGNTVDTDTCKNDCSGTGVVTPVIVCGNGQVEAGEQCDDGNTVTNDACTNACKDGRDCGTCLAADAVIGSYQTTICDIDPLCLAVERCVATTGCFTGTKDPTACFCGTAAGDCYAPSYVANGSCKAQMATASGVTNPTNGDVLDRMFDFNNAPSLGAAWLILANANSCTTECKF